MPKMIYLQEETAIRFYYLKKGRVKIFLSSPDGLEKTLAVLQPGSLFGEASFFDGKPRVSSAKTLEKSEILSIDRTGLEHCFRQDPQLAFHLLRHLSGTIRMIDALLIAASIAIGTGLVLSLYTFFTGVVVA